MIDAAWEEQRPPTLSEYTRIPCLSPAFDPDWAERGAMLEAAELLRAWAQDQDAGLTTEIVQLPGRTPVLLVENGGSGDPILIYGHMDKQPPLGEWRSGLSPFEPVREGDLLYGRGTADDGYALFAAVTGLLAAEGGRGRRDRSSSRPARRAAAPTCRPTSTTWRERIGHPRLVICLDSGGLSYDRLWLTSSLRGNLVVSVRVDVLTEGVHSGAAGGLVPSSFRILRRILSRIEDEATGADPPARAPGRRHTGVLCHRARPRSLSSSRTSGYRAVDGLHLLGADRRPIASSPGPGRPRSR